jgi:hypothetical protein
MATPIAELRQHLNELGAGRHEAPDFFKGHVLGITPPCVRRR